jgi:hypothetical protein
MANKKLLGTATSELRLPTKKVKGEKKPKWQAKTGDKKAKEPLVETPAQEEPTLAPEAIELAVLATTSEVLPMFLQPKSQPPTTKIALRRPASSKLKPTSSPRSSA